MLGVLARVSALVRVLTGRARREAEARRRESEERLSLTLEAVDSGIWDWCLASGRLTWSPGLEAIHGLPRGSFAGTFDAFADGIHPDDRERVLATIAAAVASGGDLAVEYRLLLADGGVRWVEGRGKLLGGEGGRPGRMTGICSDVTARKTAEEARARLSAVVEASADAIVSETLDGVIVTWNRGAERIFGYGAEEAVGRPVAILAPPGKEDEMAALMARARSGEHVDHFETTRVRKDGVRIEVSVSLAPIRSDSGHVVGIAKIARDITERKRAQTRDRFLAEASAILASSLDYRTTLTKLARAVVPGFADWCTVDLYEPAEGELVRLVAAHADPLQVMHPGASELAPHSLLTVPLCANGRTFGVISLVVTEPGRRFDTADQKLAEDLARRAALAIDNASLYRSLQESEDALRRSADNIRLITDALPVLIGYLDRDLVYRFANAHYERWFDRPLAGVIGRPASEVLGAETVAALKPYAEQALAGQTVTFESQIRYPAGELKHVEITYVPDLRPDGSVPGFVVLVVDLSERKRNEQDLLLKAQVLNSMAEGVSVSDEDGVILYTNPAEDAIFGYAPGELVGRHVSVQNAYEPEENARIVGDVIATLRRERAWSGEFRNVRKDGTPFITKARITAIEVGGRNLWVCVQEDITARKAADDALRETSAQLTTALDSAGLVAFRLDLASGLMQRRADARGGRGAAEVAYDDFLAAVHPDDRAALAAKVAAAVRDRTDYSAEFRVRAPSESERWLLERGRVLCDAAGAPVRLVGIAIDMTERKRAEEELERAKQAAEAASLAKSAFLANMSHEIRTPLGVIMGFSELLASAPASEAEREESVEIIKRNGRLLSTLIDDILDLSKVEAGKLEVERLVVPLPQLLEDVRASLELTASEKGIRLAFALAGAIPAAVETDPVRLKQILNNIIGNAVKFTDRGGVTVTVGLAARDDGRTMLCIEVEDTGAGMSPEQAERLFEPFMQADPSMTRRYGGTGLGLALSRRLARLLGGDVVLVRTTAGEGATFAIAVDAGDVVRASERAAAAAPVRAPSPRAAAGQQLLGMRVLVVDDAPDNQVLLSKYLSSAGASVVVAENGEEGLSRALSERFDLVLMDIQMPVMDGFEATRRLREEGFRQPIVALTAHAMREDRERCLQLGFDEHLSKPLTRSGLIRGLERLARH